MNQRQGWIINEEEKRNVELRHSLENWLLSIISEQVDSEVNGGMGGKRPPPSSVATAHRGRRGCLVCTCVLMYALTCKPALHFYGARRTKRYKAISSFHARIGVMCRLPARGRSRVPHESRKISTRETNGISPIYRANRVSPPMLQSHLSVDDTYFRRNAWRRPLALNARVRGAHFDRSPRDSSSNPFRSPLLPGWEMSYRSTCTYVRISLIDATSHAIANEFFYEYSSSCFEFKLDGSLKGMRKVFKSFKFY